jgi:hypothetical protein
MQWSNIYYGNNLLKEFHNKAWEDLQKMKEIFPFGGASGDGTYHGTTQKAYEGSPQLVKLMPPVTDPYYSGFQKIMEFDQIICIFGPSHVVTCSGPRMCY